MGFFMCLLPLLALIGRSSAYYCICREGQNDAALQKSIDYACGNGADCTAINQNGGCFQPNTVKSHCDYAVNSYFQRKNQMTGSCDFSGTATQAGTLPTTVSSTCQYQSTPSTTGTGSPGTGTGTGTGTTTPGTGTTTPGTGTGTTTPGTGTGTGTSTGTGTGTGTGTSTGTGTGTGTNTSTGTSTGTGMTNPSPVFGSTSGPSASGFGDNSGATPLVKTITDMLLTIVFTTGLVALI